MGQLSFKRLQTTSALKILLGFKEIPFLSDLFILDLLYLQVQNLLKLIVNYNSLWQETFILILSSVYSFVAQYSLSLKVDQSIISESVSVNLCYPNFQEVNLYFHRCRILSSIIL